MTEAVPQVGDGITLAVGSDRYPGTIVRVSATGKTFWYTKDDFRRTDSNGYGGHQEYEYIIDPEGTEYRAFQKRRKGVIVGWQSEGGSPIGLGGRRAYQDPHF